jgi:hypothetical protein
LRGAAGFGPRPLNLLYGRLTAINRSFGWPLAPIVEQPSA